VASNAVKLAVARVRPHATSLEGDILATFVGSSASDWSAQFQSFPSSHAATGVGLAVGLSWLYPRGWPLFVSLALLAAAQRVVSLSHFLSDTMWGAAIGVAIGTLCIRAQHRRAGANKNRASIEARRNSDRSSLLGGTGRTPEGDEPHWLESQTAINDGS
jgi:membrane-associated phospholipid phosphatase